MNDLKHYGLNRINNRLDAIATGVAWIVVTILSVFYLLGMVPARAEPSLSAAIGQCENGLAPNGSWRQVGFPHSEEMTSNCFRLAYAFDTAQPFELGYDDNGGWSGYGWYVSDENYDPSRSHCKQPCEPLRSASFHGHSRDINLSWMPRLKFYDAALIFRLGAAVYQSKFEVRAQNLHNNEKPDPTSSLGVYDARETGLTPYYGLGLEYQRIVFQWIAAPKIKAQMDSNQRGVTKLMLGYRWSL